MTLNEAENIVQKYGAALARGTDGGIARREAWLPRPKSDIIKAFKLVIGFLIEYKSLTEKNYNELIVPLSALNSFVNDQMFNKINSVHKLIREGKIDSITQEDQNEFQEFVATMMGKETSEEVKLFIEKVQDFDTDDPLFHQRLYTEIGLEFSPTKKKSFWDIFKF